MSHRTDLRRLDTLSAELPFALDDADQVSTLLKRFRQRNDRDDRRQLEVWTYCYVRRFFLIRYARVQQLRLAEVEQAIDRAYLSIRKNRPGVRDAGRYPHWVSVVCRNTYVNLVQRRRPVVAVDRVAEPAHSGRSPWEDIDRQVILEAILGAIQRLPPYLRDIAHMKLIERMDYETIAERSGKEIPTVRAYVHKVSRRLRADRTLIRTLDVPDTSARKNLSDDESDR